MSIETTSPEESVLGAILLDGALIREALEEGLRPQDFERPAHRVLFATMGEMHENGVPIDPVTLSAALRSGRQLEEAGGATYVSELPDRVPTLANFREHARIVKHGGIARAIRAFGERITRRTDSGALPDPALFLASIERDLREITRRRTSPVDAAPTVESIAARIGERWKTLDALTWLDTKPPDREYLLTFDKDEKQEGTVPLGRVGMFTGGGGQGKSWLLTQLAVCVASGAVWLDTYSTKTPGRVLLVLAEEDAAEMHRRIRWAVDGLGLSDMQKAVLRENLVPLPMMGEDVALTYTEQSHETRESAFCAFLRGKLDADEQPWRLVVLDPLSRFAGPEVEVDNAAATRFVQTLETLTNVKGKPALVVSHHTAKASRNAEGDETAARGSSALVDGARWAAHVEAAVKRAQHAVSRRKKITSFAVLKFTKVNYGPWPDELTLVRGKNGVLHRASKDELAELERLKKDKGNADDAATDDEPPKKRAGKAAAAGLDADDKMELLT